MRRLLISATLVVASSSLSAVAHAEAFEYRKRIEELAVKPTVFPLVRLSTSALTFESTSIGTDAVARVTLENYGTGALSISRAPSLTGAAEFAIAATTCNATVAPGGSCTTDVRFSPQSLDTSKGTLTFETNEANSPHVVALTGAGKARQYAVLSSTSAYRPGEVSFSADLLTAYAVSGNQASYTANMAKSSGKWYFEATMPDSSKTLCQVGVMPASYAGKRTDMGVPAKEAYYASVTQVNESPYNGVAWGYDWSRKVVGIALDLDGRTVRFVGPSGTYGPYPLSTAAGTPYVPAGTVWGGCSMNFNFGQKSFVRSVPAGFNAGVW